MTRSGKKSKTEKIEVAEEQAQETTISHPFQHIFKFHKDNNKYLHVNASGVLIATPARVFEGKRSNVFIGAFQVTDSDELITYSNVVALLQRLCDELQTTFTVRNHNEHGVTVSFEKVGVNTVIETINRIVGNTLEASVVAGRYIYIGKQISFNF